ncbi:fluoride efflux transporter CrcB [Laceyella sacchari]|nr:fluoride efflux transporter CrcB [Laceyella sacchari]
MVEPSLPGCFRIWQSLSHRRTWMRVVGGADRKGTKCMMTTIFIGLCGSLGAVARHLVGKWIKAHCSRYSFPWATFLINVSGCFALGLALGSAGAESLASALAHSHPFTTGFLGGFTTFSTFTVEWLELWQTKNRLAAMLYLLFSGTIGLLACWTGYKMM